MEIVKGIQDTNIACILRGVHFRLVEPEWQFEWEHHNIFELVNCLSGEFNIIIGDRSVKLETGDWCLIKSGKRHTTANISSGHSSMLIVHFDIDSPKIRKLLQSELFDRIAAARTDGTRFGEFIELFDNLLQRSLIKSYTNTMFIPVGADEGLLVQGHFMLMLYELIQWIRADSISHKVNDGVISSTYHLDLAHQAAVILTERASTVSISEVAKELGVSRIHLSRIFAKVFGVSPQQYMTIYKMKRSRELLATTNLSVKEIAEQLGYPNSSHFNTQYRRWYGVPPGRGRPVFLNKSKEGTESTE